MRRIIKNMEYKILYKRIMFTCLVLFVYMIGTNIAIIPDQERKSGHSFIELGISNVGGDLSRLNIFTLGLGPWLTAMIILMLFAYRNMDKYAKQTKAERHYKEKLLTLFLSVIQGSFVVHQNITTIQDHHLNPFVVLLVLVTGAMLLVWLADRNMRFGLAGPMPIVMLSIIKSIFYQGAINLSVSTLTIVIIITVLVIVLLILLFIELVERHLFYKDIMNVSSQDIVTYVAWKYNPAGSISIMVSLSLFTIFNMLIQLLTLVIPIRFDISDFLTLTNPKGVTLYLLLQLVLGYFLSRFLINTPQKTKDFLKSGNYFSGIYPGEDTDHYLNKVARRVCFIGAMTVTLIIGIPLYCALLVPHLSQEIFFIIQLVMLVYISVNIAETIKTYLYFDEYKLFLNKYW
ncbi:accessory Sec system protein translocase subunit SecY2 [Staphylococcus intermedius]|uniref:Accessory Sec system protein translocase subunit SecY2 n=1 Tax=Staphylococcus intermedius NCTC 11048 TaxID=1141106 RepID=A0A380G4A6_STAIN|nr:accessory Sec system protein translocase subunit SecY2 [Staphylococcus intermedius]PCF64360.1 accessory Sec system protein translocase subunit SecY2 [Staphylococcus intermedius]PCF79076.1 accessory Sec system protein translocase subunit SecY2 [Staphylococcus intermedius]PCF80049.1 accessory Sec system protein translocase subunit SecY2 [Staphylococcus intermedius]PCF89290.1 accessory Sec system protein translocase subunit SecY2 [Staphylococcus intermedius]PNZ48686.1 accessory Sec system prot